MPQFAFTVCDADGKKRSGLMEAANKDTAMKMLAEKDLLVTALTPVKSQDSTLAKLGLDKLRVSTEDLLSMTQSIGAMLNAGLTLKKSLSVLAGDMESVNLRQVLVEIDVGLGEGQTFSSLLYKYPDVFSTLYVAMVEAGEKSGNLPAILLRLATYIENAEALKKKVESALVYPMSVLGFAIVVVTGLFLFAIPKLSELYVGLGSELPLPTRIFIGVGKALVATWWIWVPLLAIAYFSFIKWSKTEKGKYSIDDFKIKAWLIGPLFRRLGIARFARTLCSMYRSGVPIVSAMEVVAKSLDNTVMEKVVMDARANLKEGHSITEPLRNSKVFTQIAISMMAAGEEAGALDTMLEKLADFYEAQVDIALKTVVGMIEPIIMIGVGIVIGIIVLVIALPFLNLASAVH